MKNKYNGMVLPEFDHRPIDIHSHFNLGSKYDCPDDGFMLRSFQFLESVYKSADVKQVGVSTFASVLENTQSIVEENEALHNLADKTDWIYQWVVIDPRQEKTFLQAEEMLKHPKVLGIKIHPGYHGYDIMEYGDAIFSFANKHKEFVLMHPQHIEQMPKFADKYPEMKLIIAHIGEMAHIQAIKEAKNGNIYTDTSGGASAYNNIVEYAVEQIGSEKIFFGTDTYSFAFQFGRIALSDISQTDKENILYKNAMREFPKCFKM